MAQLTALRAAANGDGCYTIKFDDSVVSPVVIPAGGPYDMTNVTWEGNGTFFGSFVEIANGASFLRLRQFANNLTVRNLNTVTSPCADLVDGDVIRISDFTNLETTTPGGVAFFSGAAVIAGGSVFVIMTESSNLGFYIAGPVFSMPVAGTFLIVLCDDLSTPIAGAPGPFAGAVGATLRLETPSLANQPISSTAAFPGWLGTFNRPVITAAPSMLPKPYLDVPSAVAQGAAFNDWLRMDVSGGAVAQTLPAISTASGFFKRPGCLLLITEFSGTAGLTIVPAAGDSLPDGAASLAVAPGGSLLLIGDGVDTWTVVSDHDPAGQNLIVWSVGEAWADVYAEIQYTQAADPESPIIVLVAYDGGTPRNMTNNGGAPTALWMVQFQSLIPDVLNTRRVEIEVDDGFVLDSDPSGEAVLSSQDIQWTFVSTTTPPFSGATLRIYLDGGSLTLGSASTPFEVTSSLRIDLTNYATIAGPGDAAAHLFDLTAGGGYSVRASISSTIGAQTFTAAAATVISIITDDTLTENASAYDVNVTPTYTYTAQADQAAYDSITLPPGLVADTVQAAIDVLKQGFGVFTFGNLNVGVGATALYLDPAYNQGTSGATQIAMRATHNGLLRALCVEHNIADATSEDITYEVFLNGAGTGFTVTLDSGAIGGADDLITEVLVAQGDLIAIQHTKTGVLTTGIVGAVATLQFIPQA